jgi:hypothetical protein
MFKYTIKTYNNKEKETLISTREYDSLRNASNALDVSTATLSNHLTGKRITKALKQYEIEKSVATPSQFIKYYNEMMKLKNDEERFKYMADKIQENLIKSL